MIRSSPVAYLLDVDNTLIDSDAIVDDFRRHLSNALGERAQAEYWRIFEGRQEELGYADYLGSLQTFRCQNPRDLDFLKLSMFLLDYPFEKRLFPKALDLVAYLRSQGPVAIVSNGDVVFQPHKIESSGLFAAVDGNVLVYIHKEQDLADVEQRLPAHHYVMIDDEPRELAAAKKRWRDRTTTIFARQGRHAHDPKRVQPYPMPDIKVERIGDLLASEYRHHLESV
jgi:beta-phosphoglucomutase-like phosphatase (HAD superfamily)